MSVCGNGHGSCQRLSSVSPGCLPLTGMRAGAFVDFLVAWLCLATADSGDGRSVVRQSLFPSSAHAWRPSQLPPSASEPGLQL